MGVSSLGREPVVRRDVCSKKKKLSSPPPPPFLPFVFFLLPLSLYPYMAEQKINDTTARTLHSRSSCSTFA